MKADDLMAFITEEAQHQVINDEHTKTAKLALAAYTKGAIKPKGKKRVKAKADITCDNCKHPGHSKPDCYSKGGGKEGQNPKQKCKAKAKETKNIVVAADDDKNIMFTFTCTSNYVAVAEDLDVPKLRLETCIDSSASQDSCPDHSKFLNYILVQCTITTADGRTLDTVGMGDLQLELPNRLVKMKIIFRNAIHTLDMAFTLISISRLDKAGFSVTLNKGICSINNPTGKTIATIPHSDSLYKVVAGKWSSKIETANATAGKISISEAHRKLSH